ncbi:class I SAM-dependent DNA methyltransferase [Paenibacillus sp. 1001270B_150601_E10]|uniref:class I SAM-dependent DNA methyltransferase n=1 Tax=Paenibacillus sp. 1001270B_150601_E10 TaxID=2787079 RepID=UPI00189D2297|nr:class I SAM-dependent methyltransferase [Paenibacillus sp. 1001270B_150601_E10]
MEAYGRFALVYDRLMEDMPYAEWLAFTEQAWKHYGLKPRSVVDLGCGTGSLTIPLAKQGYSMIGLDLSDAMLAMGREKENEAGRLAGSIQWVHQDMRAWEVPEPVDAVISYCDCLNYLTEKEDVHAMLQQTAKQLRPGGLLLMDMHHVRQFEAYAEEQPFTLDEGDVAYIWYSEYDEDRQEIEHQLTIFARDEATNQYERIDESHVQRAYDPDWIEQELRLAGFAQVDWYGDFQLEEPTQETRRLFVAAKKAEN